MKLKDILEAKGTKVWSVKGHQFIEDALEILVRKKIGAVLVQDEKGGIAGILSERDIVRACHQRHMHLARIQVKDLMTHSVITALPDDDIQTIMRIMTDHRIRHIPVLSEGKLAGIVSIGDVVKFLQEETHQQMESLKEYMYGPNTYLP